MLTSCFETPIIVKIAGTPQPRTCKSVLLVAIDSEDHWKTDESPHDIVKENHQHNAATEKSFVRRGK